MYEQIVPCKAYLKSKKYLYFFLFIYENTGSIC